MKKYLFILLLLPFFCHAEGQEGLVIILDAFVFVKVFAAWALIVFPTVLIINNYREKKLSIKFKIFFYIISGLIALFIFLMVKSDSRPYEGPMDELFKEPLSQPTSSQPDSTIEGTIFSEDTSKLGIYIWLNNKEVFVRKATPEIKTQTQQDSLTMAIVRSWPKH